MCLVRASDGQEGLKRVQQALKSRKLHVEESRYEVYASNLGSSNLGLLIEKYQSIQAKADIAIHVRNDLPEVNFCPCSTGLTFSPVNLYRRPGRYILPAAYHPLKKIISLVFEISSTSVPSSSSVPRWLQC